MLNRPQSTKVESSASDGRVSESTTSRDKDQKGFYISEQNKKKMMSVLMEQERQGKQANKQSVP